MAYRGPEKTYNHKSITVQNHWLRVGVRVTERKPGVAGRSLVAKLLAAAYAIGNFGLAALCKGLVFLENHEHEFESMSLNSAG